MNEQQFAYWFQGFAELNPGVPTKEQWQSIREHLATVFHKATPPLGKRTVDVSGNKDMQKLIDDARQKQGFQWPTTPYFPQYHLDTGPKPGIIYC